MQIDFAVIGASFFEILTPACLMWLVVGSLVGLIFGAAPGLTATTAVALFTPVTFNLPLNEALSLLLGIYCCGFYSGSIPAILISTPGAPGNAATVLDGSPMARQGKAGEALTHSVFSSWIGGTFSAFCLMIFAPMIAKIALKFGNPEYFAVGLLGLDAVAGVSKDSITKGIVTGVMGLLLKCVGMDPIVGTTRFTFGNLHLLGGITLIPALVAMFALTEVFSKVNFFGETSDEHIIDHVDKVMPDLKLYWANKWLILKCSVIGVLVGAVPGTGPTISSWIAYNMTKASSKHPEKFGTGYYEGIMAAESSNNSVTGGALIPLLTLGIPGDTVTAVLLTSLMIQGIVPGPQLLQTNYALVAKILWMLIIANIMMLALGLLGSKFFPYILKIRWEIMLPVVVLLCVTGAYATNNSIFDVKMMVILGLFCYLLNLYSFPISPMVLGLILGEIIEPNFRRSLMGNSWTIFFTRPLSCGLLIAAVVLIVVMLNAMKTKEEKEAAKAKRAARKAAKAAAK